MTNRIIPSQMPMLMEEAKAFENIAFESKGKIWSNTKDCEKYVARVTAAADKLMARNRYLRSIHARLVSFLVDSMDIDLLTQQDQWKQFIDSKFKPVFMRNITINLNSDLAWR